MKSQTYKTNFHNGFEVTVSNSVASKSGYIGYKYIRTVENTIDELDDAMNKPYCGSKANTATIGGFVSEEHTAGSFNIHSAVADSKDRAATINLNPIIDIETGEILAAPARSGLASPDIVTNFGKEYGLKFYKDAVSSVIAQAKTLNERYTHYLKKHPDVDLETYCKLFNIDERLSLNDSIYKFQKMLIPSDQLNEGELYALRRIAKAIEKNSDKSITFLEVHDNLTDRITSPIGVESDYYSKEMADNDAELARVGAYDPAMDGYFLEELIKFKHCINQGLKAGERSAITTLVLRMGPEISNLILMYIKNEKISRDKIKELGINALSAGAQGYINGFLSASLTTACLSGQLGNSLIEVDPTIIGAITSFISVTVVNGIKANMGLIDYNTYIDNTIRDIFVTGGSVIGGKIMETIIYIPVASYMIGSFIGASIAAGLYSTAKETYMSYVVENGITMFGLVEQNYVIPEEALCDIGVDVYRTKEFRYKEFKHKEYHIKSFKHKESDYKKGIDIQILKRGLIGVKTVGYIVDNRT